MDYPKCQKVNFYISEYVDGNLDIECKHFYYMYRDGYNFDDFPREKLFDYMQEIVQNCIKDDVIPSFVCQ